MKNRQQLVERPAGSLPGFGRRTFVAFLEDRLGEFQIPVTKDIPDPLIDGLGGIIEPVGFKSLVDPHAQARHLTDHPAVHRFPRCLRIKAGIGAAFVHLAVARCVPQLGGEVAVTLDPLFREADVATGRSHGSQREAQGISAVGLHQFEGIDDVALRLRHLGAGGVPHQGMDVDSVERNVTHEVKTHHHHPGNPEENDVKACHENIGRIVALQFRRLFGPAKSREGPQG